MPSHHDRAGLGGLNHHARIPILGRVPQGPKWRCAVCGAEPPLAPSPPAPPGTPVAYVTVLNGEPVYHCIVCKVRIEREALPRLERVEDNVVGLTDG